MEPHLDAPWPVAKPPMIAISTGIGVPATLHKFSQKDQVFSSIFVGQKVHHFPLRSGNGIAAWTVFPVAMILIMLGRMGKMFLLHATCICLIYV